jgi:hypothetical protein
VAAAAMAASATAVPRTRPAAATSVPRPGSGVKRDEPIAESDGAEDAAVAAGGE